MRRNGFRIPGLIGSLLLLLAAYSLPAAARPPRSTPVTDGGPHVSFDGRTVIASGVNPGARVYVAGLQLRGGNYALILEKPAGTGVAGADGTARVDVGYSVTIRSVWLAVDEKGGYTVSPGPGMAVRQMDMPGRGVVPAADGLLHRFSFDRPSIDIYVVRPGAGAWGARLRDGSATDDDGKTDGVVSSDLQHLQPVAGTTAAVPDRLLPGDVLFVIDRYSLEFAVARQGR